MTDPVTDATRPVRPYPPGWSMDYSVAGVESDGTARIPFGATDQDREFAIHAAADAEVTVGVPMEVREIDGQWCYRPALPADTPAPRVVHLTTGSQTLVAWMRDYLRIEQRWSPLLGGPSKAGATRAWLDAHGYATLADSPHTLREMIDAYEAARTLTVGDIPAGQGPASLYLWRDPVSGEVDLFERRGENWHVRLLHLTEVAPALRDHLAAHLPHVTTEDAP